jgi:CO/xanthine dehydrogenase FAD-binding subunit
VVRAYKAGLRHGQNERGVVNCAMWVRFGQDGKVEQARLAFGGLYGAPILAPKAAEVWKSKWVRFTQKL